MRWILDNKQWIFSGVGVFIIGGLLTMVVRFLRRRAARTSRTSGDISTVKASSVVERSSMVASPVATGSHISQNVINIVAQQTAAQKVVQKLDEYSPNPSPQEIYSQLNALPTFQQQTAAKNYAGIKVCWRGTFFAIDNVRTHIGYLQERDDGATHFVILATSIGSLIKVPVDIERFPRLKVTHARTPMEVRGTIVEIGPAIELRDATLSFVDGD